MQIDGTLAFSIGGVVASIAVAWGIVKATVAALEKRMDAAEAKVEKAEKDLVALSASASTLDSRACEDRVHNQKRFEELYLSRNEMQSQIAEMTASVDSLCKRFERVESKIDAISTQVATVAARVETLAAIKGA